MRVAPEAREPQLEPPPGPGQREDPGERWSEERWQALPLDHSSGESLGEVAFAAFNDTLRETLFDVGCADEWRPPKGTVRYGANWEIRLVPVEKGHVVEDARVIDATLSDEDFERCVRDAWVGTTIPVPEERNASVTRARVVFGVVLHYRLPPRE